MKKTTRRTFVKQTGVGVAALATFRLPSCAIAGAYTVSSIPAHRAMHVPGVHAYPLEHSVATGDILELCISASVPYRVSICRLGRNLDDPSGDEVLKRWEAAPAHPQPIHPGSYVDFEKRLEARLQGLTLECWVRPWDIKRLQGIINQEDTSSAEGFGLSIDNPGRVRFFLGDSTSSTNRTVHCTRPEAVTRDIWHHVIATWDGKHKRIFVNGDTLGEWEFAGGLVSGLHRLRLGAMAVGGTVDHLLDGDLAMPAVYGRAMSAAEAQERFQQRGTKVAQGSNVLACWPLSEERGDQLADVSGHAREGRIINHGTWMIGGPSFDEDVPRFEEYSPEKDPLRGHGLRLASDDLYDCRWQVSHRWPVPFDAPSGFYVARIEFSLEGLPRLYHCTFIVRRAAKRRAAPILLIAATNTWRAYGGTPFALTPSELKQEWDTGGLDGSDGAGLPAYCLYRAHAAGQGTYQVGLRMPWPAAGPYVLYSDTTEYSHLMRADRFAHVWFDQQGYKCDVVSNVDLHRNPDMLREYQVCAIVGHNEYWSRPMYEGIESYLRSGGNLLVLSGNTMYWRVSFNKDCSIMECRKADGGGSQVPAKRRGEAWHSQDGLRGGLQRECGIPSYRLVGLDIIGWNNPSNPKNFGPYVVEHEDHFLFTTPQASGLKNGDRFGWAAEGRMPIANGHEMDIRPSTFAALQQEPSPTGGVVPPDPPGIVRIANGIVPWSEGGSASDYFGRSIQPKTDQGGEMIYWERVDGGRVFNAATIAAAWALHADPRWAMVMQNVLHHFGVPSKAN